jgi:peptide deformylase
MSEIFKYNTEEAIQTVAPKLEQPNVFKLVSEEHPVLKQYLELFDFNNPPVNPMEFASTLVETCKLHRGMGLSANQCGFPYRVFVMGAEDQYVAFYNPKLLEVTEEKSHGVEGCLSFPFLALRITRPESIKVQYQDYTGSLKEATFSGMSARCFQHKLDHMNGIVYTQKVKPLALQMGIQKRNKLMRKIRIK